MLVGDVPGRPLDPPRGEAAPAAVEAARLDPRNVAYLYQAGTQRPNRPEYVGEKSSPVGSHHNQIDVFVLLPTVSVEEALITWRRRVPDDRTAPI